mmetsp:Transcript_48361/g.144401  ORF Transcript_48361/g.144401 Transcript_48361/m.144401 type:complete len:297 (-) Transcript_48361:609-1499(-)
MPSSFELAAGPPTTPFSVFIICRTSARNNDTCLAVAWPWTYFSPVLNSSQLTLPSPLTSSDLKISVSSSELHAPSCGPSLMPSETSGEASSSENSSTVRPSSPPLLLRPLKPNSSVSTYSAKSRSFSCRSASALTEVMCSVITPVRRAIMAKAVRRVYAMRNTIMEGLLSPTSPQISAQSSSVTIWNIVIMLRSRVPNIKSICFSSSTVPCGGPQSWACCPMTVVQMMPATKTTATNSTAIQVTACIELKNPFINRCNCLKCLITRHARNTRTIRMMRRTVNSFSSVLFPPAPFMV